MKCIVIVNTLAGHYNKLRLEEKIRKFSLGFEVDVFYLDKNSQFPDITNYQKVVVFGGDGTLNSFLNAKTNENQELIYSPIGTLNESAKNSRGKITNCLTVNDKNIAYVVATGIFTPLGYNTKTQTKKRFKVFAYLFNVIKEYKLIKIKASIGYNSAYSKENGNTDYDYNASYKSSINKDIIIDKSTIDDKNCDYQFLKQGEYSLIMCIKSKSCFGFKFNKICDDSDSFELLTVKAPKHNGLLGKIELFFPLFRCFFIGFKEEYQSKNIEFKKASNVKIILDKKTPFCLDGEKGEFDNSILISIKEINKIDIKF